VLSWIRDESSPFQTFISNRISLIQELSNAIEWHYVPTACNPADILSRGALSSELIESSLWSHGPDYFQEDKSHWPESCLAIKVLPEVRKKALITLKTPANIDIPTSCKFVNSGHKLMHVFGYTFKFGYRIRHPCLTVNHLTGGMKLIIRSIQMAHLTDDYYAMLNIRQVKSSSSIPSLAPIIDNSGLMRVGGRSTHRWTMTHSIH